MAGGTAPRQKGNRFEREVVDETKAAPGLDSDRTWGSNGRTRGLPEEVDVLVYEGTKDDYTSVVYLQAKRGMTQPAYLTIDDPAVVVRFTETSTERTYYLMRYATYLALTAHRLGLAEPPVTTVVGVARKKLGELYKPGPAVVGQVFRGNHKPAHITVGAAEWARINTPVALPQSSMTFDPNGIPTVTTLRDRVLETAGLGADPASVVAALAMIADAVDGRPVVGLTRESPDVSLPARAHDTDSGADVRWHRGDDDHEVLFAADGSAYVTLGPNESRVFGTGLTVASVPEGYEIQVRPRSGLAAKQGITVLNAPGTVDQGYRGPLKVILVNTGRQPQTVHEGDRIAQLVVARYHRAVFADGVATASDRGAGGLGSTGK